MPRLNTRKNLKLSLLTLLLLLGFFELSSRVAWHLARNIPILGSANRNLHYLFYPILQEAEKELSKDEGRTFKVLVLGGSVASTIPPCMKHEILARFKGRFKMINTAASAESSRDVLIKYKYLSKYHPDLIIYYDAINELRANNTPPGTFRNDYTHYSWYRDVSLLESKIFGNSEALFSLRYLWTRISDLIFKPHLVPQNQPEITQWLQYGDEIKTKESFRQNLQSLATRATQRNEPLLLLTFAYYVPSNYTMLGFLSKKFDYGPEYLNQGFPIEIWGFKKNILSGLEVHNQIIRDISVAFPNIHFFDMEKRFGKNGENFVDICHLTYRGCQRMSRILMDQIMSLKSDPRIAKRFEELELH